MRDPTLASVPFFLFMGYLLEQSGLMERLFRGVQLLFASLRGSLYLAVLITATIFAAATGIVGSSVTLLGVMAAPAMKRSGYDIRLSAGVITAGGTLGILIPPSVMLIVMGPVVGVPATDLFAAAVIPGLLLSRPLHRLRARAQLSQSGAGPGTSASKSVRRRSAIVVKELLLGIAPIVVVILATLGVILAGIATPTDAGAVGSFAVLLLTLLYRRMSWNGFCKAVYSTLEVSCMILLLVAASNYFGAVFSRLGSANLIAESLLHAVVLADGHAAADSRHHLRARLAARVGADRADRRAHPAAARQQARHQPDLVLHARRRVPADGMAVAARRAIRVLSEGCRAGLGPLKDIYAGMMQFMVLQIVGLLLVLFFPQLALWLPELMRN